MKRTGDHKIRITAKSNAISAETLNKVWCEGKLRLHFTKQQSAAHIESLLR